MNWWGIDPLYVPVPWPGPRPLSDANDVFRNHAHYIDYCERMALWIFTGRLLQ